ncbi:MAG: flagellar assembly protein FliW [Mariprofundaceae bacterium]
MNDHKQDWSTVIEVKDSRQLRFEHGMIGFPEAKNYVVLKSGNGNIVCFQSVEQPEAAFLMTPWDEHRLGSRPTLTEEQKACLQYTENQHILWLLVLNPFSDPEWVFANLCAPVAVNMEMELGMQCIQAEALTDFQYRWMPQARQTDQAA